MHEKEDSDKAMIKILNSVAEFIKNIADLIESGRIEQIDKAELAKNMYKMNELLLSAKHFFSLIEREDAPTRINMN